MACSLTPPTGVLTDAGSMGAGAANALPAP